MSETTILPDVYPNQDFYVPAFEVLVSGKKLLKLHKDVISLTYGDAEDGMDWAELTVNNWNPDKSSPPECWKYSNEDDLSPWQPVEIRMGYYRGGKDELHTMMLGELVRLTPDFAAGAPATLGVRAVGVLNRFRTAQISKDYHNKKDSEIFKDIVSQISSEMLRSIKEFELTTDANELSEVLRNEEAVPFLTIKQQYALNFLFDRAKKINYEISIENSDHASKGKRKIIVHFRPAETANRKRAVYDLQWGKSLISFKPSISTAIKPNEVIVRSWNPTLKQKFEGRATLKDLEDLKILDPTKDVRNCNSPLSKKKEIVTNEVVQSNGEAKRLAISKLASLAQNSVVATGRTIGLPELRSGVMVNISGFGPHFDGGYIIQETTHRIDYFGYTTEFTARLHTKKTNGAQPAPKQQ